MSTDLKSALKAIRGHLAAGENDQALEICQSAAKGGHGDDFMLHLLTGACYANYAEHRSPAIDAYHRAIAADANNRPTPHMGLYKLLTTEPCAVWPIKQLLSQAVLDRELRVLYECCAALATMASNTAGAEGDKLRARLDDYSDIMTTINVLRGGDLPSDLSTTSADDLLRLAREWLPKSNANKPAIVRRLVAHIEGGGVHTEGSFEALLQVGQNCLYSPTSPNASCSVEMAWSSLSPRPTPLLYMRLIQSLLPIFTDDRLARHGQVAIDEATTTHMNELVDMLEGEEEMDEAFIDRLVAFGEGDWGNVIGEGDVDSGNDHVKLCAALLLRLIAARVIGHVGHLSEARRRLHKCGHTARLFVEKGRTRSVLDNMLTHCRIERETVAEVDVRGGDPVLRLRAACIAHDKEGMSTAMRTLLAECTTASVIQVTPAIVDYYSVLGKWDIASRWLRTLPAEAIDNNWWLSVRRARIDVNLGGDRTREYLTRLGLILQRQPYAHEPYALLARHFVRSGQSDRATKLARRAVELAPKSESCARLLMEVYSSATDVDDELLSHVTKCTSLWPTEVWPLMALFNHAAASTNTVDSQQLITRLQTAVGLDLSPSERVRIWRQLADVYEERGANLAAIQCLQQLIDLPMSPTEGHHTLCTMFRIEMSTVALPAEEDLQRLTTMTEEGHLDVRPLACRLYSRWAVEAYDMHMFSRAMQYAKFSLTYGGRSPHNRQMSCAISMANAYILLSRFPVDELGESLGMQTSTDLRLDLLRQAVRLFDDRPDASAKLRPTALYVRAHACYRISQLTQEDGDWLDDCHRSLVGVVECDESTAEQRAMAYCHLAALHGLLCNSPRRAIHYSLRSAAIADSPLAHLCIGLIVLRNDMGGELHAGLMSSLRRARSMQPHNPLVWSALAFATTARHSRMEERGEEECAIDEDMVQRLHRHAVSLMPTCPSALPFVHGCLRAHFNRRFTHANDFLMTRHTCADVLQWLADSNDGNDHLIESYGKSLITIDATIGCRLFRLPEVDLRRLLDRFPADLDGHPILAYLRHLFATKEVNRRIIAGVAATGDRECVAILRACAASNTDAVYARIALQPYGHSMDENADPSPLRQLLCKPWAHRQ